MTLTLGWWLLPAAITLITLSWCFFTFNKRPTDALGVILQPFIASFYYGIAVVVSLAAWLIWALLT
jgi:hypothetical protein